MTRNYTVSRRLLLGAGVKATFLLPTTLIADLAAAATPAPRHARRAPAARPPRLVVLDPGHGGKDPGAIGISGTYEKHVALATAFELKRQLEASGQYHVELTRARDIFIPLEHRVEIAERHRAMLFVSMHADALSDPRVRGASIYTLGAHASDAQTRELARRENSADRFAGPDFQGTSPEVAEILASLVQHETRVGSARLAHDLVGALGPRVPLLSNPTRHAGFVVLKAADIPSVLVEMGFMSNRQDEAALRRPAHRVQVAQAMKHAVDAYFAAADQGLRVAG
ncbi:N-acetylmuramoyl-L-alanine amidase family protein [Acidibrevibacterium fodinaquatile]|jgi:N-acetylmuramoyl-L-alanine amidase|uniref:N-acetylmuramoyl-L-alanine amidase family protein n=1 Tax=Acidibrevibacterium fodinaquatile TaxID=1969806 RepID=UPI000E0CE53A|nr:N-acetylmuramoyl-L-alanine amidase [Acidibrevibacterium fodinaquatile]